MKRILVLCVATLMAFSVAAQQPAAVVKAMLAKIENGVFRANYMLSMSEKGQTQEQIFRGKITMKGAKSYVQADGMQAWYDGKTQWVYLSEADEVSISEPTATEAAEMNPMLLVKSLLQDYNIIFSVTEKSAANYIVEFYPKNKWNDMQSLVVRIRKTDKMPMSVDMKTVKGAKTHLVLTAQQTGLQVSDATFVFDRKQFPKVQINDLR